MKSQIWRLAGVSVLSLAMCANALADDTTDARPGMGGGSPQRDQGRGNPGGGYQGGNQGGGQQSPRPPQQPPQQQPQNPERQSNAGRAAQRERDAAVQKQTDRREFVENYKGGPIPSSQTGGSGQKPGTPGNGGGNNQGGNGWNNGHNNNGHNNNGHNNGGYNGGGYNGGYNGGRDDDNHGRPSNGGQQWQGSGQISGGKPPQGNQWNGGRPGGGWGSGPHWQPGYRVNNIPAGRWRVPHGGIDYYYAEGYWYRPYGPSYVVVTPPYGVRVRTLPSYAEQLWIGSALYFIAAGTYYLYEADRQEYVVASPPVQVTSNNGWQGNGYDVVAYPANGQSQAQQAQDRYDCHRWAVNQSGFDPSQATYAPAANVADVYRRSLGACLAGRGYSVN